MPDQKLSHRFLQYFVLLAAGLCAWSIQGYSQTDSLKRADTTIHADTIRHTDTLQIPDSVDLPQKKRFWRASGELMLAQVIPWSVNYFIRDADFAHISFSSIWYNLNLSHWEWDDNKFATNQFAHPYQGSLYYSSFRTNGYSFWQAAPAAFAGSFMWEVAGETHPGAPNDFINTSMGGISLGEMSYRVANLVVNDQQRGFKRQLQEIAALVINPMYGFNRILDGKWGRVRRPDNPSLKRVTLHGLLDGGIRQYSEKESDLFKRGRNEWYAGLRFLYGDPFKDYRKPFDNFLLQLEVGGGDTAHINVVKVGGNLYGWQLSSTAKATHIGAITANYDYYRNSSFFYSGQSINFNVYSNLPFSRNVHLYSQLGAGIVILAAVPDAYLYYGEGRNYDYGPGISLLLNERLQLFRKLWFHVTYRGGWTKTINGNKSSFFLHAFTSELRYDMFKNVSAGVEWGYFFLDGTYKDYDDVQKKYPYLKAAVGIQF
ncbi:DUF3943 domain-containing protein [Deminuibacter soli]|uniref:DUF3943 domain-containing protein n=1 Tax=Deminuibacter soli TaxID=2291815 RepID=A0A3E1NHH1_9BACT|nr:DUF3943 domain-containing protein [Deminuibacter soli]RFM27332.1 DUF3943 domain-containing protein [Deminuibacter soli]